jgi:bis(5'-adenosyl)-triphosphatase
MGRRAGEWVKDEDRKARGMEEMEAEAKWLREEMERDAREEGKL